MQPESLQEKQDELMNLMTIMYTTLQEILNDRAGMAAVQEKLCKLSRVAGCGPIELAYLC